MGEWARLRAGTTVRGGLERGFWYPVHLRQADGVIWLRGPDESTVPLEPSLIRVIDHAPNVITRVPETEFETIKPGAPAARLRHYGICPRGHFIKTVGADAATADCGACGQSYPVEDEDP